MKKPVQWGILSTARINRRLIPVLHSSERCELRGVASRDRDRGIVYAAEWKIPKVYPGYEMLLADPAIEVVYIPLPNDLHTVWVIRALEAGKHVLCEKPLCLTTHEFEEIRQACGRTGKSVMEAFMYRHHPQTALFRQIVDDGQIGTVRAMYSEFTAIYNRPNDNYRMDAERGGGALWDIGVYPISFFLLLDQSPIIRTAGSVSMIQGIDMSVWGTLSFASGVTGQFFASFESEYSTRTSIMGTGGRLDITHPFNGTDACRAWLTINGERSELDLPKDSLYAGEVENMNDIAMGASVPRVTLEDSRRVLDAVLKIRQQTGAD